MQSECIEKEMKLSWIEHIREPFHDGRRSNAWEETGSVKEGEDEVYGLIKKEEIEEAICDMKPRRPQA